jgi:hypothetical protein
LQANFDNVLSKIRIFAPSLFNIYTAVPNIFIDLYSITANRPNLLEIASNSNNIFKNKCYNHFFCENIKLSEDSLLFPHIHSIAYGKWAINIDSYNKFDLLFKEYNINTEIRGTI